MEIHSDVLRIYSHNRSKYYERHLYPHNRSKYLVIWAATFLVMHFVSQQHKCRSRQIFRSAKDFCPLILQTHPKKFQKMIPKKKKTSAFDFWYYFFKSKHIKGNFGNFPKLARISPNSTKKTPSNSKIIKNICIWFWAWFVSNQSASNYFAQDFTLYPPDFRGFCPDFKGMCPDFHQIKTFGGALVPHAPHLLHQWSATFCLV